MRIPRIFRSFIPGKWIDEDIKVAIVRQCWRGIRMSVRRQLRQEFVHDFSPDFFVGLLPALKAQFDPHFHVVAQKLNGLVKLHPEIVGINAG